MEEFEEDVEDSQPAKDWLTPTDNLLSQLRDIKKSYYRLGGGPREREVDCRCNYRTQKSSSHYRNLTPEPPQLSAESQETASADISVADLVHQCHKHAAEQKPVIYKRPRPHSSVHTDRVIPNKDSTTTDQPTTSYNKAFIAVKGQTVKPQSRPESASRPTQNRGPTDEQSIDSIHKATLDDLLKFSAAFAAGQDKEPLPPPPCSSPDLFVPVEDEYFPEEEQERDFGSQNSTYRQTDDQKQADNDILLDLEERPELVEDGTEDAKKAVRSIPVASAMVFTIPTGDAGSDVETAEEAEDHEMPLGESLEKADTFINTLKELKKVEKKQINKCVNNINKITLAMGTIDLYTEQEDELLGDAPPRRPVSRLSNTRLSRPSSSRSTASVSRPVERKPEVVAETVKYESESVEDTESADEEEEEDVEADEVIESLTSIDMEPFWVEEPSIPIVKVRPQVRIGSADPKKKLRPSSSNLVRSQNVADDGYLIQGKTIEFMDATDLLARRPMAYSKPVRPPSAPQPATKRHSVSDMRSEPARLDTNPDTKSIQVKITAKPPKPTRPTSAWTSRPKSGQRPRIGSAKKSSNLKQHDYANESESQEHEKYKLQTNHEPVSAMSSLSDLDLTGKAIPKTVTFEETNASSQKESASPISIPTEPKITQTEREVPHESAEEIKAVDTGPTEDPYIAIQDGIELANAINRTTFPANASKAYLRPKSEVISQVGDFCRQIARPTMTVIGQGHELHKDDQVSPRRLKTRVKSASSLYNQHQRQPKSPRSTVKRQSSARKLRVKSASHLGKEPPVVKPTRPQSAITRKAFDARERKQDRDFEPLNRPFPPFPSGKRGKSKGAAEPEVIEIRHTDDELVVPPSVECETVYSKLQERGINIPMETITKGLMAPARKAPAATTTQGLPLSSSSTLLSHPQVWLAKEFRKLKKAERALRDAEVMLAKQAEEKARARARALGQTEENLDSNIKSTKRTKKKSRRNVITS